MYPSYSIPTRLICQLGPKARLQKCTSLKLSHSRGSLHGFANCSREPRLETVKLRHCRKSDAGLFTECLEHIQQTAHQILNAFGAGESFAIQDVRFGYRMFACCFSWATSSSGQDHSGRSTEDFLSATTSTDAPGSFTTTWVELYAGCCLRIFPLACL